MKTSQMDTQLTFNFTKVDRNFGKVRVAERAKDSEGKFATEKEDPNIVNRLKLENRILRVNYGIWLEKRDREIKRLKNEIKRLKNDNSNRF